MIKSLLLIMALSFGLCVHAQAETIFQGKDAQGNPTFSDTPFPGSKPIEIQPAQTYEAPPTPKFTPTPEKPEEIATNYTVSITTPKNEQTFNVDITSVPVILNVSPALNDNDEIQIYLNGSLHTTTSQTSLTLDDLYRGAYTLQAKIVSKDNPKKAIAQSSVITFYQQRAFIRQNSNAN